MIFSKTPAQTVIDADGNTVAMPAGFDLEDFGYVPSDEVVTLPAEVQRELFGIEQMSLEGLA